MDLSPLLPSTANLPRDTSQRWSKAMHELLSGGGREEALAALAVTFAEACDQLIIVRDIGFTSVCEHHLFPFTGKATLAYLPSDNRVVGLSKLPRTVQAFARALQVQERLTRQIADVLEEALKPRGVGVIIEAQHTCASLRGARATGSAMTTSELRGVLRDDPAARAEFFKLARP